MILLQKNLQGQRLLIARGCLFYPLPLQVSCQRMEVFFSICQSSWEVSAVQGRVLWQPGLESHCTWWGCVWVSPFSIGSRYCSQSSSTSNKTDLLILHLNLVYVSQFVTNLVERGRWLIGPLNSTESVENLAFQYGSSSGPLGYLRVVISCIGSAATFYLECQGGGRDEGYFE